MNKTNNLRAYLRDLYEGIVSKKPDASRNPQNFRSEIEAIRTGGEFYEVMDASELPLDAPDGSLALVEGEPIPQSYIVSSVDELPSGAVDGSMAIVTETVVLDGAGTWVFKDELDNLGQYYESWENGISPFEILFSSQGTDFEGFNITTTGPSSWGIYCLNFRVNIFEAINAYTHNPEGSNGITHGWNSSFKTINVSYADKEAKKWLEKHAIQTVKGEESFEVISVLCIRENGEWVYKCEVV